MSEAVRCWVAAVALDPDNAEARDYLESAGGLDPVTLNGLFTVPAAEPAPPAKRGVPQAPATAQHGGGAPRPEHAVDRVLVERLVAERRYEEALALLHAAREHAADDPSIERGIRLLEDRLIVGYARQLGGLDQVPRADHGRASAALGRDERSMLALVDGVSSLGEILGRSTLPPFSSYRALASLASAGIVRPRPGVRKSTQAPPMLGASAAVIPPAAHVPTAMALPHAVAPASLARPPLEAPPPPPPAAAPPAPAESEADRLFAEATGAYVRRDYGEAARLYEACLAREPAHKRARFNLDKLRSRERPT